ncbi:MAG: NUDIX domain-containing protein, partial [Candidatus Kapabacteria bacterium]|nr:NUDIX domain-containing protein [Candidatus Kapabacteria bacterium]
MNQEWLNYLRRRLREPLPGHAAHRQMLPQHQGRERPLVPPSGSNPAAVLVLFIADAPTPTCVLTLRAAQLTHHRGEWSFPGGMLHTGESAPEAAIREATEELGIPPEAI